MKDAIRAVRGWLGGASLDELVVVVPFLDQPRRALQAIGARLDPRLHWEIGYRELWVTVGSGHAA